MSDVNRILLVAIVCLAKAAILSAGPETSCAELNALYVDRYVYDFSLDKATFEISNSIPLFECNGTDKNFIMARAINDLDLLRPVSEGDPDYYAMIVQVLHLDPNNPENTALRYVDIILRFPNTEAKVVNEAEIAAIFFTRKYMTNGERIRPTYSLVHEVRHTMENKTFNGYKIPNEPAHVKCIRYKNKGIRVCDQRLGNEEVLAAGSGNSYEFLFLHYLRTHPKASKLMKRQAQEQLNYLATYLFNDLDPGILEYYDVQLLK